MSVLLKPPQAIFDSCCGFFIFCFKLDKSAMFGDMPLKAIRLNEKSQCILLGKHCEKWIPATTYSPGPFPAKYHRREEA